MFLLLRLFFIYAILSILWHNAVPQSAQLKRARKGNLFRLGWPVLCKFQPQSYDCSFNESATSRFYFDVKMRDCKTFDYSDCLPSYNNFMTLSECHTNCRWSGIKSIYTNYTANIYCRFQPEFGDCNSYYPMFYYDQSDHKCKGFAYSGCGGNRNKFQSPRLCKAVCLTAIPYPKHYMFMTDYEGKNDK